MKMYQIDIEIYYDGSRSKECDIDHLTIEFAIDKAYYKKHKTCIRSTNSYHVEGERDIVPVSYITLFVSPNSAKVVKEENIKQRYDATFHHRVTENKVVLSVEGLNAFFDTGLPRRIKK